MGWKTWVVWDLCWVLALVSGQVALISSWLVYGVVGGMCDPPGVATAGAVDWAPIEDFRFIMEVNYFAVINMTKVGGWGGRR